MSRHEFTSEEGDTFALTGADRLSIFDVICDVSGYRFGLNADEAVTLSRALLDASGANAVVVDGLPEGELTEDGQYVRANGYLIPAGICDPGGPPLMGPHLLACLTAQRIFEQHPPVDPQVKALADDLRAHDVDGSYDELAAALVAKGWTRPEVQP